MTELILHDRPVPTVFDLAGHDENDMTAALGWGLARSAAFLRAFGRRVAPGVSLTGAEIRLQEFDAADGGYTDIEVLSDELHVIVEAKKGWWLPSTEQLRRYEHRFATRARQHQRVVVLTQIGAEEVVRHALAGWSPPAPATDEVLGWAELFKLARDASHTGPLHERRVASELATYLRGVAEMRDTDSNSVYVVALGSGAWAGWGDMTMIRIVEETGRYFFPATGKNWPKMAPNYMGFRYRGTLQSIHHVESYVIHGNPYIEIPGAPDLPWDEPHYVLRLGPPIRPDHEVRTGPSIVQANRVWCDIDLLLTSATITDALVATRARRSE